MIRRGSAPLGGPQTGDDEGKQSGTDQRNGRHDKGQPGALVGKQRMDEVAEASHADQPRNGAEDAKPGAEKETERKTSHGSDPGRTKGRFHVESALSIVPVARPRPFGGNAILSSIVRSQTDGNG